MNDVPIKELPKKPEPHRIFKLVRQGTISLHQLSLRIEKSYFHTANIVAGRSGISPEIEKEFDRIMEELDGTKNKKKTS